MRCKIVCMLVAGLLVLGAIMTVGAAAAENGKAAASSQPRPVFVYATHLPIRIDSDPDFQMMFPGHEISGLDINGTGQGFCIYIGNCSQPFTIKDCYLHNATGKKINYYYNTGLYLYKSSNGNITNNTISLNNERGINAVTSHYLNITGNALHRNRNTGIYLSFGDNVTIKNNVLTNEYTTINLFHTTKNTIVNNTIKSSSYIGMMIDQLHSSLIINNTIENSNRDGIEFHNSNANTIAYNNITGNAMYGMHSWGGSSMNRIYYNNFIGNNGSGTIRDPAHVQANDTGSNNFWNNSVGGNHWGDWTSPDTSPNDGIVDQPYQLDGDASAMDLKPLVDTVSNAGAVPEFIIPAIGMFGLVTVLVAAVSISIRRRRRA